MVMKAQGIEIPAPAPCDLYIGSIGEEASVEALRLCGILRGEGFSAECDIVGRSVKAQMKYADKIGARFSMVLGDNELAEKKATVKNMATVKTPKSCWTANPSNSFCMTPVWTASAIR